MASITNHIKYSFKILTIAVFLMHLGIIGSQAQAAPKAKSVVVTNTPTIVDIDSHARQPFQVDINGLNIFDGNKFAFQIMFSVPEGKRAVIENFSIKAELPDDGQSPTSVQLETIAPGIGGGSVPTTHFFTLESQGVDTLSMRKSFVGNHLTRLYADPLTNVTFRIDRSDDTGTASVAVRVSGYLVDLE